MKHLGRILVGVLIITNVFALQLSNADFSRYAQAAEPTAPELSQAEKDFARIPKSGKIELEEKRTKYSKTYLKSDGSKELVTSLGPTHYQDKRDGMKWKDIDVSLKANQFNSTAASTYSNKQNKFNISLSPNLSKMFSFAINNSSISVTPELPKSKTLNINSLNLLSGDLASVKSEVKGNKIKYRDVYPSVDMTLYSVADGLKEDIIINKYTGKNVFNFNLVTNNAFFTKEADGSYKFYSQDTKEYLFTMPRFFMWDSKGGDLSVENNYSYNLTSEIIGGNNRFTLKLTADAAWLSSPDRVFPVTIDPSVTTDPDEDTYVQSGYPTVQAWDQRALYVGDDRGRDYAKGVMRPLVKFNLIEDLGLARISSAQINMYQYNGCHYDACYWEGLYTYSTTHFDPKTVNWYDQPGDTWGPHSGSSVNSDGWFSFDAMELVNQWYYGDTAMIQRGGFEIRAGAEGWLGYRTLVARNHPDYQWAMPQLIIQYNDYDAAYEVPPTIDGITGTTADVHVTVKNTGRNTWYSNSTAMSYHLYDSAGRLIANDGLLTYLPANLGPDGQLSLTAKVKVPPQSGTYSIAWDLIQPGITWFSSQGIGIPKTALNASLPSFSSVNHLGSEDYYAKAGPVDLATGSLSFSSTDITVPSNSGSISLTRSYNSNNTSDYFAADADGFIHKWLINGLYRSDDRTQRLTSNYLGNDAVSRPNLGSSAFGNMWFGIDQSSNFIDLGRAFADNGYQYEWMGNAAAYAHIYVFSPVERDSLLRIGSDDGLRVWLNNTMLTSQDYDRGSAPDQDLIPAHLSKGWNSVMIKINNNTGGWGLFARLSALDGGRLTDLQYSLNNPEIFDQGGVLGQGWTTNFEEKLFTNDPSNIYYRDGNGSVYNFVQNQGGSYRRSPGTSFDLSKNAGGNYSIRYKDGSVKQFNAKGKIAFATDLSGNKVLYRYNGSAQCISIEDGTRVLSLAYNPSGYLASVTNQLGAQYKYVYETMTNGNVRFIGVDYPNSSSSRYTFTNPISFNIASYKDPKGNETKIKYLNDEILTGVDTILATGHSSRRQVSQIISAAGNTTTINYSNMQTEVIDALGRKSTYAFNEVNLLTSFTDPKNYQEVFQYDGNYNLIAAVPIMPENEGQYYKYSYTYDANDNLLLSTDPLGNTSTNTYTNNDLVKTVSPKGEVETFSYSVDGRHHLIAATDPRGNTEHYGYDSLGRVIYFENAKGQATRYGYTADGDLASQTSPKGENTSYTYDVIGRKISDKSPMGKIYTYEYNAMSWLNRIIDPAGLTISLFYDLNGNMVKKVSASGDYQQFKYNKVNGLTQAIDEVGAVMTYGYDAVGNRIKITDAKGKATTFVYDELNQLVSKTDPAGNISSANYDRNGNVVQTNDENGIQTSSSYDRAGNLTSSSSGGRSTSLSYDGNGNPVNISESSTGESSSIVYDGNGNATTIQSNLSGISNNIFDALNQLTQTTNLTNQVNYGYDANGQINQVTNSLGNSGQIGSITLNRDADGKLISMTNHNALTTSYIYGASSRLTRLTTRTNQGVAVADYSYKYDKNGNVLSETDVLRSIVRSYSYDARGELLSDPESSYSYDPMGNMTKKTTGSAVESYTYDEAGDANRLTKIDYSTGGSSSFSYDKIGNLIKAVGIKGGESNYTYDKDGYFAKAVLWDGTSVEYKYSEITKLRTERIQTNKDGSVKITKFLYNDGDKLITETDGNGNVQISYTWDEDENLASFAKTNADGTITNYLYVKNAKGDIVGFTNESGQPLAKYQYDSWGNVISALPISPSANSESIDPYINPRLYSGYWYDTTLKLYFMKTRMYNPRIGRFLSPDSRINGDTALAYNPYLYCGNNPISRTDPSGKMAEYAMVGYGVGAAGAAAGLAVLGAGLGILALAAGAGYLVWYMYSNPISFAVPHSATGTTAVSSAGGGTCSASPGGEGGGGNGPGGRNNRPGRGGRNNPTPAPRQSAPDNTRVNPVTQLGNAARHAGRITGAGSASFEAFKRAFGAAGNGMQWHHIVEQSQIAKSGFSSAMINNINNLVAIDAKTHGQISGYYSSIKPFTDGLTVRAYLIGMSFEEQYQFGLDVLRNHGLFQ